MRIERGDVVLQWEISDYGFGPNFIITMLVNREHGTEELDSVWVPLKELAVALKPFIEEVNHEHE